VPEDRPLVNERWHHNMFTAVQIIHASEGAVPNAGMRVTHVSFRAINRTGFGHTRSNVPLEQFVAEGFHYLGDLTGHVFRLRQSDMNGPTVMVVEDAFFSVVCRDRNSVRSERFTEPLERFLQLYVEAGPRVVRASTPFGDMSMVVTEADVRRIQQGTFADISMGTSVAHQICPFCHQGHSAESVCGHAYNPVQDLPESPLAHDAGQNLARRMEAGVISAADRHARSVILHTAQAPRAWQDLIYGGGTERFTERDIVGFSEAAIQSLGLDDATAAKIREKYAPPKEPVADPPDVWDRLLADDDD
jgi:hypothetical protein